MFNAVGAQLPAIDGIADALAKLSADDPLTRTYARWVLRGAGKAGIAALTAVKRSKATRGALVFLGQIVEERVRTPVPYLGESVVFDGEAETLGDDEDMWLAMVETEQHFELDEPTGGSAWEPDRIMLQRKQVTLVTYDWEKEDEVERVVKSKGSFTMSRLLHEAFKTYLKLGNNPSTRIFEGLERTRDGVYRIKTGS
jgi:hypothetical protein